MNLYEILRNELFDKRKNVFNINDTRIICSSWSRIYSELVLCLLTYNDRLKNI